MATLIYKHDARTVFAIPELVAVIGRFCDKPDLVRMSRVCRTTFYEVAPLVWSHVEGIHNFLGLLPGIRTVRQGRRNRVTLVICALELPRLQLYVASIRTIKIYSAVVRHYDVTDWPVLIDCLESQTLPPNLQPPDLTSTCLECVQYQLLWAKAFACSSLTAIFWIPSSLSTNSEISTLSLNGLVDLLAKKSPHIEKLSLFSGSGVRSTRVSVENAHV